MLVYELLVYAWHRTMHRVHWIWRSFHQMHHSAERVDSYGAFYFSPLDLLFGTFRNPQEFASESGFYDGASAKVPQILMFRDIAGSDFDPAMKLGRN